MEITVRRKKAKWMHRFMEETAYYGTSSRENWSESHVLEEEKFSYRRFKAEKNIGH